MMTHTLLSFICWSSTGCSGSYELHKSLLSPLLFLFSYSHISHLHLQRDFVNVVFVLPHCFDVILWVVFCQFFSVWELVKSIIWLFAVSHCVSVCLTSVLSNGIKMTGVGSTREGHSTGVFCILEPLSWQESWKHKAAWLKHSPGPIFTKCLRVWVLIWNQFFFAFRS